MSSVAKTAESGHECSHRLSDSEILLFVARTLQPHFPDADAPDLFAKLQKLKGVFDLQASTLVDWPQSAGKDRMRDALTQAKILLTQIFDDLASAARNSAARDAQSA